MSGARRQSRAAKRSAIARVVQAIVEESASASCAPKNHKLVSLNIPEAGGKLEVFFEVMPSPPKLIVVGAGHIAVPLVKIAKVLDFHVTVIDDRLLYANRERFPDADEVLVGDMAQMLKEMTITPSCYIVLITRGHAYDEPCLRVVLPSQAKYIGMIGSRRRIKACFQRFRDEEKICRGVDRTGLCAHRPRYRHRNAGGNRTVDSRRSHQSAPRRQGSIAFRPLAGDAHGA